MDTLFNAKEEQEKLTRILDLVNYVPNLLPNKSLKNKEARKSKCIPLSKIYSIFCSACGGKIKEDKCKCIASPMQKVIGMPLDDQEYFFMDGSVKI